MNSFSYEELFDHIDSKRMEDFLSCLTDDIVLAVANNPAASGKEAVRASIGTLWQSIHALKHHIRHVIESQDYMVFESMVSYTRLDKKMVQVPCATIMRFRGPLVSEWRVYVDVAPVFSPA